MSHISHNYTLYQVDAVFILIGQKTEQHSDKTILLSVTKLTFRRLLLGHIKELEYPGRGTDVLQSFSHIFISIFHITMIHIKG